MKKGIRLPGRLASPIRRPIATLRIIRVHVSRFVSKGSSIFGRGARKTRRGIRSIQITSVPEPTSRGQVRYIAQKTNSAISVAGKSSSRYSLGRLPTLSKLRTLSGSFSSKAPRPRFTNQVLVANDNCVSSTAGDEITRNDDEFLLSLTVELLYHAERLGQEILLPLASTSNLFITRTGESDQLPTTAVPKVTITESPDIDGGLPSPSVYSQPSPLADKMNYNGNNLLAGPSPLNLELELDFPSPSIYSQDSGSSPIPQHQSELSDANSAELEDLSMTMDFSDGTLGYGSPRPDPVADTSFEFEFEYESPGQALRSSASILTFRTHISQMDYTLFDIPEEDEEEEEESVSASRGGKISFGMDEESRLPSIPVEPITSPGNTRTRVRSSPTKLMEGDSSITNLRAHLDTLYRIDLDLPSLSEVSSLKCSPVLKYGFDLLGFGSGEHEQDKYNENLHPRSRFLTSLPSVSFSPFQKNIESPSLGTLLARKGSKGPPSLLRESISLPSFSLFRSPTSTTKGSHFEGSGFSGENILTESFEMPSLPTLPSLAYGTGTGTSISKSNYFFTPSKFRTTPVRRMKMDEYLREMGKNTIAFPSISPPTGSSLHIQPLPLLLNPSKPRRTSIREVFTPSKPPKDVSRSTTILAPASRIMDLVTPSTPTNAKDWILKRCPWLAEDGVGSGSGRESPNAPCLGTPKNPTKPVFGRINGSGVDERMMRVEKSFSSVF